MSKIAENCAAQLSSIDASFVTQSSPPTPRPQTTTSGTATGLGDTSPPKKLANVGLIAGATIGAIGGLGLTVVLLLWCRRRRRTTSRIGESAPLPQATTINPKPSSHHLFFMSAQRTSLFTDRDPFVHDGRSGEIEYGSGDRPEGAISPFTPSIACDAPHAGGAEKQDRHADVQRPAAESNVEQLEVVAYLQQREAMPTGPRRTPRREEDAGITLDPEAVRPEDRMPPAYDSQ